MSSANCHQLIESLGTGESQAASIVRFCASHGAKYRMMVGANQVAAQAVASEHEKVMRKVPDSERAEILRLYANGTGVSIADLARKFNRQHSHITHIVANKPPAPKKRPALEAEILAGHELNDIATRHGVGLAYMRSIRREMVSRGKLGKGGVA